MKAYAVGKPAPRKRRMSPKMAMASDMASDTITAVIYCPKKAGAASPAEGFANLPDNMVFLSEIGKDQRSARIGK